MEIDKVLVEKQAKEILEKFAKALEKAEKNEKEAEESYVERDDFERKEASSDSAESESSRFGFKENFLKNAPCHDDDFIIAEKGAWK